MSEYSPLCQVIVEVSMSSHTNCFTSSAVTVLPSLPGDSGGINVQSYKLFRHFCQVIVAGSKSSRTNCFTSSGVRVLTSLPGDSGGTEVQSYKLFHLLWCQGYSPLCQVIVEGSKSSRTNCFTSSGVRVLGSVFSIPSF